MNAPLQHLEEDLAALRSAWAEALPPFGAVLDTANEVATMSDAGLIRITDAAGQVIRDAEAVLARVAGEVARRSPAELGKDGLAKQQGFRNPARLIAAATGGSVAAATRAVTVGTATAPQVSLTGEVMPAKHPHVAAAVGCGSISVEAAAAITSMLDRVASRANPEDADQVEVILAERAAVLPLDLLLRVIREAEARLDHDGIAPREEELRADRYLSIREDGRGMLHLKGCLDPETGAPVKAAIEAIVTHTLRANGSDDHCRPPLHGAGGTPGAADGASVGVTAAADAAAGPDAGPVVADERTIPQMQADALGMIARHALGCGRVPSAAATTLVVRTDLDTLVDGIGSGSIDGLTGPISAGTVRKMAASAGIIPAVLGTDSLPLDLGRAARLFSWGQRIALGERDGGCACCGLDVSYTQAHHIDWWKRDTGPTNLNNGILLCPPCHTRIHEDGWSIRIDETGQVWFTPPPHVDPDQAPRLGGKARFTMPPLRRTG